MPKMHVDADTRDAFGHRRAGAAPRDELVVRVYADATPSSFTLYEDDGTTLAYAADGRPSYPHRTTVIRQAAEPGTAEVTIEPAVGRGRALRRRGREPPGARRARRRRRRGDRP